MPDRIDIEGIVLIPVSYRELDREGGLEIHMTTKVAPETDRALQELLRESYWSRRYYRVVRDDEPPIELRFGQPRWSQDENGFRYFLPLFDRRFDEKDADPGSTYDPMSLLQRQKEWIAGTAGRLDALLDALEGKGVLSTAEVNAIREPNRDQTWGAIHRMHEIRDAYGAWRQAE